MPISHGDWREIQALIAKAVEQKGEYFVQDVVTKNDPINKLIWTKEFGDQAIPLFCFDLQVKYYDSEVTGASTSGTSPGPYTTSVTSKRGPQKTRPYTKEVEVLVPKVGEVVLIARQLGSRRLPKCIGVLHSRNFITSEGGT